MLVFKLWVVVFNFLTCFCIYSQEMGLIPFKPLLWYIFALHFMAQTILLNELLNTVLYLTDLQTIFYFNYILIFRLLNLIYCLITLIRWLWFHCRDKFKLIDFFFGCDLKFLFEFLQCIFITNNAFDLMFDLLHLNQGWFDYNFMGRSLSLVVEYEVLVSYPKICLARVINSNVTLIFAILNLNALWAKDPRFTFKLV